MDLNVGPYRYQILAVSDDLTHPDGGACHGLADPTHQRVMFSMELPPAKRWSVVWHELAHLARADLDIHGEPDTPLGEEAVCNLIGLVMAMIRPMDLMRLHVYVTQGVDAPAAMLTPNLPHPIPVMPLHH